jgi:hypothetical protein
MTSPRLNLIVIRSLDAVRLVAFYRMLGISFVEEQHGNGPVHWAADLDGLVLEVYPAKTPVVLLMISRRSLRFEGVVESWAVLESQGTSYSIAPAANHDERSHEAKGFKVGLHFGRVPDLAMLGFEILSAAGFGIDLGDHFSADAFSRIRHCLSL